MTAFIGKQSRRDVLVGAAAFSAAAVFGPVPAGAVPTVFTKPIPATGEQLPVIGMGSWITFDVGNDKAARVERVKVLQAFFDGGGAVVDSSPMYLSSQEVIGYCLAQIVNKDALFAATKVWTPGKEMGIGQMEGSRNLWGVERFDLLQIHNMLDWETHLETLLDWKQQGRVRYIGITTSHGRRHDDMEAVMKTQPFDFVQFTYNILDREVEERLLPLAAERGTRRHRQPAVPPRRPDRALRWKAVAGMGGGDRLHELAAVPAEVRGIPSGGDLRDPCDFPRRSHAGEYGRR